MPFQDALQYNPLILKVAYKNCLRRSSLDFFFFFSEECNKIVSFVGYMDVFVIHMSLLRLNVETGYISLVNYNNEMPCCIVINELQQAYANWAAKAGYTIWLDNSIRQSSINVEPTGIGICARSEGFLPFSIYGAYHCHFQRTAFDHYMLQIMGKKFFAYKHF